MNVLRTIVNVLLFGALLAPSAVSAQIVEFESASIVGSWYAPDLGFYGESDYQLDFGGSYLAEAQLDFGLPGPLVLRASAGHWQQRSTSDLSVDDPANARHHEATLRIVPISASLIVSPVLGRGPRPVVGAGVIRNLIQRSLQRTRLDGTGAETFAGNGRDTAYLGVLGVLVPVAGPVWLGLESRYVWGRFEEERTISDRAIVSIDGLQLGFSLRYHVR